MEDSYIKEIFDNYYNKVLNFELIIPKLILSEKIELKNKTIKKIRVNTTSEIFNFVLIEMKNKAIVIENCGYSKKIYKFKNKKLSNLSNAGVIVVDIRKKRVIENCYFKEGKLHNWEDFAVDKGFNGQYWINGIRYKDLDEVNKFKIQKKVVNF